MKISERKLCRLCHLYEELISNYNSYITQKNSDNYKRQTLKDYEEFKGSNIFQLNESVSKFMNKQNDEGFRLETAKQHLRESYDFFRKDFPKSTFKYFRWITNIEKILKENQIT